MDKPYRRYEVLLPLRFNDGNPVPDELLAKTMAEEHTLTAGYIYVLANSSMPELVKIGKTRRHPVGRAQELSGATGVPTPFIVVYEMAVTDCDQAEVFIHSVLARKGYRVSDNREFFRAPIPEVIEAILSGSSRNLVAPPGKAGEFSLR